MTFKSCADHVCAACEWQKEDQMKYMKELLEEINEVNDIIRIGHPAIAALIQAKFALAMRTKIDFHYEFTGLDGLALG